ncbi:hypothetical protein HYT05_01680, partial [Candidatus Kaiserbacteria bacterium]|nr:hypothetical protein [Candidatus Kaiserbacteria bacterium]
IAQNYVVTAQSNAIHNLSNVTIGNPTITGGSISGTSVAATSLSISGSATTTSGGGFDISSGCFSVKGTCVTTGGSGSWPFDTDTNFAASVQSTSTPLWLKNAVFASSTSQFVNASSSQQTIAGALWLPAITSALLSTNASGQVVASTTIGWNLLKGPASSLFAFDASGNPTATTSIGTNYITGLLGTVNGTAFNRGDSITVAAASSTLLSDNNTFSGANIFSSPLVLSGTSGTTTIAAGQGFTIGSSQFVLQQGSGRVGIGTTSPRADLHVAGSGQIMVQNGNTLQDRGGDFWMTSNAYFDGTDWRRQDASKTAFSLDLRGSSNLPNEAEQQ